MINYSDCPFALSEFLFYMETIKNMSPRTINGYYIDLRLFLKFMKLHRSLVDTDMVFDDIPVSDISYDFLDSVTTMDVYEYLHFIMNERNNSPSSRSRKISALRSFYKYLTVKSHKITNDPVKDIEVPSLKKSLPKFLTLNESLNLLDTVSGDYQLRDYCIITLFLNCGMRLAELVGINCSDISEDSIRIVGKGNKERIVYLNEACLDAIKKYSSFRSEMLGEKREDAFFVSKRGNRITPRRVEQIVNENLAKAGLDGRGFSPHKLRHTAATLMYRYGDADMLALKEILGHEHVSTTEIYTHISDEQLKKAAESSPLASVKNKQEKND